MGRPRRQHQADDAAKAASEAAKVLQQRSQAVKEQVPSNPNLEPPEGWTPPKRYSEQRSEMLEEIVASRAAETVPEPEPKPVEEPKPESKPEPEPEVKAEVVVPEKPVEVVPEAPKTVKVKVDGEEFEVSQADVDDAGGVRAYQIQRAAENRLKKTNDVLAEIRKAQAEFMELQKQSQKPKEPDLTDQQFAAERMDKIRFGTPEEAAQAQLEILQRVHKPIDQGAWMTQAQSQFEHNLAVKKFDREFQDIVTNPDLLQFVVTLRNQGIAQLKGPVDWDQFYTGIGNKVRGIVGKPTSTTTVQSTTSGTPSQQSTKEEKKAAAAVSVPASAARAAPPKEEKPETREDMLRNMRKSRGLPVD